MADTERLTQEALRALLSYNRDTGIFCWIVSPTPCVRVGKIAGKTDQYGYIRIKISRRYYRAHRLAWLYEFGAFPIGPLDHRDGNPANNAIDNLRNGISGINQENVRRPQRNNSTGFLGVSKRNDCSKWRASISVKGKPVNLGSFDTPEEAHAAYLNAKRQLHAGCTI